VKGKRDGYQRLGRREVARNQRFVLYFDDLRLPGGHRVPEFLIVKPKVLGAGLVSGVCVLPLVDGKIGLMRSYRHQLGRSVWQAVAGFVESGESLRATASREIAEETPLGCPPRGLVSLGRFFPEPGLIEGALALYLAPCTRRPGAAPTAEIGTGKLTFFAPAALERLLARSADVGGSTLVACYRYLARRRGTVKGPRSGL
jgi:8-oxo-dGTP pyrophosphatase MutT (NUDIX family)